MNQRQGNALVPPKSPYRQFIEENDEILNSISKNEIQFEATSDSYSVFQSEEEDSEYYESLKESLDSINAKLGIVSKTKDKQKANASTTNIDESTDNSIAQFGSQSDILPSDKMVCPSPLDKPKREKEDKRSISSKKVRSSEVSSVIAKSELASSVVNLLKSENDEKATCKNEYSNELREDQKSHHSNVQKDEKLNLTPQLKEKSRSSGKASISSRSNNNNNLPNKSTNVPSQTKSKQIITPQNSSIKSISDQMKDNNSISSHQSKVSNSIKANSMASNANNQTPRSQKASSVASGHDQTPNSPKANSVISNNNDQTPNSPKANSVISNNSQTPASQKANSVVSNHCQSPDSPNANSVKSGHSQTPSNQKANSVISGHSHTTRSKKGSTSSIHRSMISTSYIDYIDAKQKRILEKWKKEDLEEERKLEEEMIDRLLTPKHTWKTFKFTSPRPNSNSKSFESNSDINSNFNEEDETDQSFDDMKQSSHRVFEMPPNPSANLKQLLEIPTIERLLTPKKNFVLQQQQNTKRHNSTRPKKIRPVYEDDFVSRQAHYENEKRLKNAMKETNNQKTKRTDGTIFNKLYEKSIVEDSDSSIYEKEESSLSGDNEKRNKIKWSNRSHLVESKKLSNPQPPINTSSFRDDRFSPNSRRIAQNVESRSFQERTSIDFDDVLKQNREEQDQMKSRELYEQYMQKFD